MPKRNFIWVILALAVAGLAADQLSKYRVFSWLYNYGKAADAKPFEANQEVEVWVKRNGQSGKEYLHGGRHDLWPGWFGFISQYSDQKAAPSWKQGLQTVSSPYLPRVNEGALFGIGGQEFGKTANLIYAIISGIAAVGIGVWTYFRGRQADLWICIALGLIWGGTIGNMYDRIVFEGVRDFLYFYKIDWPVFNVADMGLVTGAIMLVLHAFLSPAKVPVAETPSLKEVKDPIN